MPRFPTGPLPRLIGPYLVSEKIGAGGMATVYRARHAETGDEVAIKVLALHLEQEPEARAQFQEEAARVQSLRYKHILPVHDYGEDGDIPYIVMPLLGGRSLADLLTGAPLPIKQTAQIVNQLSLALIVAHAHGIIHRDIKPANVLLDDDGTPYLADFGIAAVIGAATPGEFVGTAAYASPEQCVGEPVSPASDQYALGVIAFEMLTGRRPFEGPTALAVLAQHVSESPPDPRAINPALPQDVSRVFDKVFAKKPAWRYRDAYTFGASLDRALGTWRPPDWSEYFKDRTKK